MHANGGWNLQPFGVLNNASPTELPGQSSLEKFKATKPQVCPSFIPVLPNKMELLTETFSTIRPSARSCRYLVTMRVMIISLSYTQTCMHPKCKPLRSPWLSMATALPQCHAFPTRSLPQAVPQPTLPPLLPTNSTTSISYFPSDRTPPVLLSLISWSSQDKLL